MRVKHRSVLGPSFGRVQRIVRVGPRQAAREVGGVSKDGRRGDAWPENVFLTSTPPQNSQFSLVFTPQATEGTVVDRSDAPPRAVARSTRVHEQPKVRGNERN